MTDLQRKEDIKMYNQIINFKKRELKALDYVVIKIYEAVIDGDTALVEELKTRYASQLKKRKEIREKINELENKLREVEVM